MGIPVISEKIWRTVNNSFVKNENKFESASTQLPKYFKNVNIYFCRTNTKELKYLSKKIFCWMDFWNLTNSIVCQKTQLDPKFKDMLKYMKKLGA